MSSILNSLKKHVKLVIVVSIIVFSGILLYQNQVAINSKKIETATVKKGTLEEKLTISGTIDALEKATLRFQTSGRLSWVGVKEGDKVKKYQTVASLDQRDVEANLKKKLLSYMDQRWDFEQTQADNSIAGRRIEDVPGLTDSERRIIDKSHFDLESSVVDVEIAALAKEYSLLWTPIDGIITGVGSPYAGVNSTPAQAEINVVNPESIYFSANADETEVTNLRDGLLGELVLDSYPDKTLKGAIKNISFIPKVGETNTVYEVKFTIGDDNSEYRYRLGMGGDLTFVTNRKENVLYLPAKFIKTENGKKFINTKKNGKEDKVYINTGLETDTDMEVSGGVKEGDTVLL